MEVEPRKENGTSLQLNSASNFSTDAVASSGLKTLVDGNLKNSARGEGAQLSSLQAETTRSVVSETGQIIIRVQQKSDAANVPSRVDNKSVDGKNVLIEKRMDYLNKGNLSPISNEDLDCNFDEENRVNRCESKLSSATLPVSRECTTSPVSDGDLNVPELCLEVFQVKEPSLFEKSKWTRCKLCSYSCPPNGGFRCTLCEATRPSFLVLSELFLHVQQQHSDKVTVPKCFECDFCGSKTNCVVKYDAHIKKTHLCAEPHVQCEYGCGILLTKASHRHHMDNVHGFFCDLCNIHCNGDKAEHIANIHNSQELIVIENSDSEETDCLEGAGMFS